MKPAIAVLLALLATQVHSQNLTSTLHTTLYGVRVAYVDEMVVFTCILRESNNLIWTSNEYIGPRRQLSLTSVQPPQTEVRAVGNDQTVAVLINATIDVFIESELRIRVVSTYPTASVQCVNGASPDAQSSTLFRLDDPASVVCDRQLVCPGVTVTCTCATANSNTLAWIINGTREEFMSSDILLARRDILGSSGFVVLTENSDVNGIRVIMSNLTITVSSSEIVLTCENVDQSMTESTIVPIDENCPTNPVTTPSGNENAAARGSDSGVIAAAVLVPVILLGFLLIVAIVVLIILYRKYKPLRKQCDDKIKEINVLKGENEVLKQENARHIEEITVLKKEKEVLKKEKARHEDTIQNLQALLLEREKQLRDKVGELKKLNEQGGANRDAILKLQTETRDKDATIRTQKRDLDANAKTIQHMTEQLEKVKTAAAAELKKKVNSIKEEHMAALELMEKNMKKRQQDAFKALKETVVHIKVIKERTSGETSADPEKDKVKDSKQAFETLKDKMKESIDTTSSDLEKILEEEINKILEDKKGDTPSKKSSSRGLFSLGKHK